MERLDQNRQNAIDFYEMMFNACEPRRAIERFVGAHYRQHNPHVVDGKEGFIAYFERMAREYPGKEVRVVRTVAEGDLVVLENTGAAFLYGRERHNYITGCPEDDCHGSIRRNPIRVANLDPDFVVDLGWSDYLAGRDPWIERALELSAE